MAPFYNDGNFYNDGHYYGGSSTDTPQNLSFYRTTQDGIYVFWWGFNAAFISPALFTYDYELQLDTVPTFNSPNLQTFVLGLVTDITQPSLPPFTITQIVDGTHLTVSTTTGLTTGDTIAQAFTSSSTTISAIPDSTHLTVASTSGFIADNVITYQNGNVVKGFAVPVAARIDKIEQVWYAQVRVLEGMTPSPWSNTLVWTIPAKQQQQFAENLMNTLPDYHVYGKGDLLKPVNQRNSNLYLVDNMYGNQLDAASYINFLTQSGNYVYLCVDESLYQNFGVLFNFPKPTNMQYVDYRWILIQLIAASLEGSTNDAVSRVVAAFTGVSPLILNVRDENDFFLNTIQDPPIVPSGPTTIFYTSYPYISGTLVVEDITTGLLRTDYTTDPAQGTWTMNTPTTDTLQATFDVGTMGDPVPLVFDSEDNTALSGLITFTNGSVDISGIGTTFIAQLITGNEITDLGGIYLGTIQSVIDDTHAVLVSPWAGPSETSPAFKLHYTDTQIPVPINWDASTLAFGVIIDVLNPGEFPLT